MACFADEPQEKAPPEETLETEQEQGENAHAAQPLPLPDSDGFVRIAESEHLILRADPASGHFIVTDKRSGEVWKSFPESGDGQGQNQEKWSANLESPLLFTYVEFNVRRDLAKESNLKDGGGVVTRFALIDQGFQVQYEIPKLGFVIPAEVKLGPDYVETRLVSDGLEDERDIPDDGGTGKDNAARLVSVRLFPFLGAHLSDETDGYLLLPDGPGALVEFRKDRSGTNNYYSERVYGADWAFSAHAAFSIRKPVRMPVFGIKAGNKAFIAVIHEGAEYANIIAAPSGTFSPYNWAAAEHQFRFMHYQYTNTRKTEGYVSYTREMTTADRSVRYYLLPDRNPGYVDMAQRYRDYLMEEVGMRPLPSGENKAALQLHLLGADRKRGFLRDTYLPLTTTGQAQEIVQELISVGIERMSVTYLGWQRKGYSSYGGSFPISRKLGGNDGMKELAGFLHAKGFPLFLDGSVYSFNNTRGDGFRRNRDGLRDQGASVVNYRSRLAENTLVSPRFAAKVLEKDLRKAKELNVDGFTFGQAIGSLLNTDYNENYAASREEAAQIQQQMFRMTREALGQVQAADGNGYVLPYVSHIHDLPAEGSGDLFVDRQVPFAQIALHGLVTYSFDYANNSEDYETHFLRGIEYGAVPSFVVTYAPTQELFYTRSLGRFFSTYYKDWMQEMVSQYQRFNEALGDVQHHFITDHRALADGVYETVYGNGKRIVVNYTDQPYSGNGWTVPPRDFAVVRQGE
jgi:hypothetical protein